MQSSRATAAVIDAHVHIWRQADLPWLVGPPQPRIFGPYEPIRRDYPLEELAAAAVPEGVAAAVYVQANWAPERAEEEVAWVSAVADAAGWPMGIVGHADVTAADVRPALDRLLRYPRLRGIRHQLHWHENPLYRFATRPDLCADPTVQRNIARLAEHGLVFELQVFPGQFSDAARLLDACPDVTFVLQHAGMLEEEGEAAFVRWREGLAALAARPNLHVKLSGLGTFRRRLDPDHVVRVTGVAIALFGAERCLFGSNFPIESLWTTYAALLAAHQAALDRHDEQVRHAVMAGTATRIYQLHNLQGGRNHGS